jgi:hypothetical protein
MRTVRIDVSIEDALSEKLREEGLSPIVVGLNPIDVWFSGSSCADVTIELEVEE